MLDLKTCQVGSLLPARRLLVMRVCVSCVCDEATTSNLPST